METILIIFGIILIGVLLTISSYLTKILDSLNEVNKKMDNNSNIDNLTDELGYVKSELETITTYFHELNEALEIKDRIKINRQIEMDKQF